MKTGNRPADPRCPLGAIQPLPMNIGEITRAGWVEQSILVANLHDPRFNWMHRQMIQTLAEVLLGKK